MAITNRTGFLIGIPKRLSTQPFGRLRRGQLKPAIKVSGKMGIVSRPILKGREGQDCMV